MYSRVQRHANAPTVSMPSPSDTSQDNPRVMGYLNMKRHSHPRHAPFSHHSPTVSRSSREENQHLAEHPQSCSRRSADEGGYQPSLSGPIYNEADPPPSACRPDQTPASSARSGTPCESAGGSTSAPSPCTPEAARWTPATIECSGPGGHTCVRSWAGSDGRERRDSALQWRGLCAAHCIASPGSLNSASLRGGREGGRLPVRVFGGVARVAC